MGKQRQQKQINSQSVRRGNIISGEYFEVREMMDNTIYFELGTGIPVYTLYRLGGYILLFK